MNKKWVVCLFFLGLTISGIAKTNFETAKELFGQKRYSEAAEYFEKTVKEHPDWFPAVYLKGRCYYHLNKFDEALRDFNDALTMKVTPEAATGIKYYVAMTHMNMKDYDKAVYSFSRLIPEAPRNKHFSLYLNRGQCEIQLAHLNEKHKDKAKSYYHKGIVSFTKALEAPTQNQRLIYQAAYQKGLAEYKLAAIEKNISSLEKSIAAIEQTIALDPSEKMGHELLVSAHFKIVEAVPDKQKQARYLETIPPLEKYLKQWPNDTDMLEKKGKALQGGKKYREAIAVFQDLVDKRPDAEAYFSLGSCQMAAARYGPALKSFETAKSLGENGNPALYSYTSHCLISQKTNCYQTDIPLYERAVQVLEKGMDEVAGAARASLSRDLERTKTNLDVLKTNKRTDNQNHLAAIDNITKLKETISENTRKLQNNRENYIDQPTQELKAAIGQAETSIKEDKLALAKELETLTRYIEDADKCGGQDTFEHYARMRAILDEKGA